MSRFRWTEKANRAAELVAADEQSDEQIAADIGMSRAGLKKWKANPDFAARVAAIVADNQEKLRALGLADKRYRVQALNKRHEKLERIISERGQSPAMQSVPGGKTGLIVVRWHAVTDKDGKTRSVPEYAVDTGLLKEMREHEKQAAQELGQWTEKKDVSGSLVIEFVGVDPDAI